MARRRMLWQVFIWTLIITTSSLLAVGVFGVRQLRTVFYDRTTNNLVSVAGLVREQIGDSIPDAAPGELDSICQVLSEASGARITLILPDGTVVGDSEEHSRRMHSHAHRPEVVTALSGETGMSVRFSPTLQTDMRYAAIPVVSEGKVVAIVRAGLSVHELKKVLRDAYIGAGIGWIVIVACVALAGLIISRRISRPIEVVRGAAERLAGGDLRVRVPVHANSETADLASAINRAAALLEDRITSLVKQRNEQHAVLSSMVEGVIALDSSERVMSMNRAASRMLDVNPLEAQSRTIQEVVRNSDLQQFISRTLAATEPVEGDIVFERAEQRFFQAHGTQLRNARGEGIGAVIVLNDVTRLRQLERVRSEFVANVSHELKTPITSIKGFVETIQNGAIENAEDTRRFLDIVARHADRLNSIVDDLLALSRIEQDAESGEIGFEERKAAAIVRAAVLTCQPRADEKGISVAVKCGDAIRLRANPALIEQALVNLLDNAIKYNNPRSTVEITVDDAPDSVSLSVRDEGPGIEERHHKRIFERFYRVDRARSRDIGGTGLGLSIVRNIAVAHGGSVSVNSAPGKGSTFTIRLPK